MEKRFLLPEKPRGHVTHLAIMYQALEDDCWSGITFGIEAGIGLPEGYLVGVEPAELPDDLSTTATCTAITTPEEPLEFTSIMYPNGEYWGAPPAL